MAAELATFAVNLAAQHPLSAASLWTGVVGTFAVPHYLHNVTWAPWAKPVDQVVGDAFETGSFEEAVKTAVKTAVEEVKVTVTESVAEEVVRTAGDEDEVTQPAGDEATQSAVEEQVTQSSVDNATHTPPNQPSYIVSEHKTDGDGFLWDMFIPHWTTFFRGTVPSIAASVVAFWGKVSASAEALWNTIPTSAVDFWNSITVSAVTFWNTLSASAVAFWNTISTSVATFWNTISMSVAGYWCTILATFFGLWASFVAWFFGLGSYFGSGVPKSNNKFEGVGDDNGTASLDNVTTASQSTPSILFPIPLLFNASLSWTSDIRFASIDTFNNIKTVVPEPLYSGTYNWFFRAGILFFTTLFLFRFVLERISRVQITLARRNFYFCFWVFLLPGLVWCWNRYAELQASDITPAALGTIIGLYDFLHNVFYFTSLLVRPLFENALRQQRHLHPFITTNVFLVFCGTVYPFLYILTVAVTVIYPYAHTHIIKPNTWYLRFPVVIVLVAAPTQIVIAGLLLLTALPPVVVLENAVTPIPFGDEALGIKADVNVGLITFVILLCRAWRVAKKESSEVALGEDRDEEGEEGEGREIEQVNKARAGLLEVQGVENRVVLVKEASDEEPEQQGQDNDSPTALIGFQEIGERKVENESPQESDLPTADQQSGAIEAHSENTQPEETLEEDEAPTSILPQDQEFEAEEYWGKKEPRQPVRISPTRMAKIRARKEAALEKRLEWPPFRPADTKQQSETESEESEEERVVQDGQAEQEEQIKQGEQPKQEELLPRSETPLKSPSPPPSKTESRSELKSPSATAPASPAQDNSPEPAASPEPIIPVRITETELIASPEPFAPPKPVASSVKEPTYESVTPPKSASPQSTSSLASLFEEKPTEEVRGTQSADSQPAVESSPDSELGNEQAEIDAPSSTNPEESKLFNLDRAKIENQIPNLRRASGDQATNSGSRPATSYSGVAGSFNLSGEESEPADALDEPQSGATVASPEPIPTGQTTEENPSLPQTPARRFLAPKLPRIKLENISHSRKNSASTPSATPKQSLFDQRPSTSNGSLTSYRQTAYADWKDSHVRKTNASPITAAPARPSSSGSLLSRAPNHTTHSPSSVSNPAMPLDHNRPKYSPYNFFPQASNGAVATTSSKVNSPTTSNTQTPAPQALPGSSYNSAPLTTPITVAPSPSRPPPTASHGISQNATPEEEEEDKSRQKEEAEKDMSEEKSEMAEAERTSVEENVNDETNAQDSIAVEDEKKDDGQEMTTSQESDSSLSSEPSWMDEYSGEQRESEGEEKQDGNGGLESHDATDEAEDEFERESSVDPFEPFGFYEDKNQFELLW